MPRSNILLGGQELKLDADADTRIQVSTDDVLVIDTAGSERMRVDAGGDIGIGVPTESDHYSAYVNINFGLTGLVGSAASGTNTTFLTNNAYLNTSPNWIYKEADEATKYNQVSGTHIWETASSGSAGATISFTEVMKIDANGQVTKPLQPAFSVTDSGPQSDYATNSTVTIGFDTEVFDVNGDFASSTFTAPVTGKYVLCGNITFSNLDQDADFTSVTIDTSNRNYTNIIDPEGFDKDLSYFSFTITVVADMDASDTAKMTFYQSAGSAVADLAVGQSYFSGYLLG